MLTLEMREKNVEKNNGGLLLKLLLSHLLIVCLFGSKRRINPCGSLASDGIKLNIMLMEKVKIYKIK